MARIRVFLNIGLANASQNDIIEIPDEEWDGYTDEEKEELLTDISETHLSNHLDYGAYLLGDGENE